MPTDPVFETITQFTAQLRDSWDSVNSEAIDIDFTQILNIVVCGMGGSALGGRIVHTLTAENLAIPIEVVSGYHVPFYVGERTLVILSSYSGGTEETLASFNEALVKKGKLFVITTGGRLAELARENAIPHYVYTPQFNPSKQPRLALGYSVGSLLALLSKAGFLSVSHDHMIEALHKADNYTQEFVPTMPDDSNEAKRITNSIEGSIPILIASEHLLGASHAFKNQLNETAKTFSALFDLPELNHHLLEGLSFPENAKNTLKFVFIESDLYSDRVKRRYSITKDVLTKQGFRHVSYLVRSSDKLSQVLELLTFASFVQYYLALKNEVKMMEIPWVDYFKEEMSKEE